MSNTAFVFLVASGMILYIWAGLRILPSERWQILACVPVKKLEDERWDGLNLTWYGALCANGVVAGTALFFALSAASGVSTKTIFIVCGIILLITVPAGRLVAYLVEGKRDTFTTGGGEFCRGGGGGAVGDAGLATDGTKRPGARRADPSGADHRVRRRRGSWKDGLRIFRVLLRYESRRGLAQV